METGTFSHLEYLAFGIGTFDVGISEILASTFCYIWKFIKLGNWRLLSVVFSRLFVTKEHPGMAI